MDRAISKMNGRDCGALGWDGSDAVMIGSRVHESGKFSSGQREPVLWALGSQVAGALAACRRTRQAVRKEGTRLTRKLDLRFARACSLEAASASAHEVGYAVQVLEASGLTMNPCDRRSPSEQRKTLQKSKREAQRRKLGEGDCLELTLLRAAQRSNATLRLNDAGLCRMLLLVASKSSRLPKVGGC
jgi:hypothetical protein